MATKSKGKGGVAPRQWAKHLRPYWKQEHNSRVRQDGKREIEEQRHEEEEESEQSSPPSKASPYAFDVVG